MKNIFYLFKIILCFTTITTCSGQSNISQHRADPNANKFVGIWKWGDTNNGVTLIMKKENNVKIFRDNNDNTTMDVIIGFHKIYKNGMVTEDTTMFSNTNFIDKKKSFIAGTENNNPNTLAVYMTHKNKNIEITISYIDPTHIKITDVRNQEGVRLILPGQTAPSSSIDIPNDIILTKQ